MPAGFEYRGKRLVQKRRVFLTSGTFYPSKGLLEAGGVVDVYAIGGGGSGGTSSSSPYGSGGSAGQTVEGRVVVAGPTAVVIGAGGAGTTNLVGNTGGSSSFGDISAPGGAGGGYGPVSGRGGAGSGGHAPIMSGAAVRSVTGWAQGTPYAASTTQSAAGGPPNRFGHGVGGNSTGGTSLPATNSLVGGGGDGGASGNSQPGGNGMVELIWWEYNQ